MGALQRTKAGRHQTWVVVGGPEKTELVPLLRVWRGGDAKGPCFEECCVFKIFKISRFLSTADTHNSTSLHEASRETQEQGANL